MYKIREYPDYLTIKYMKCLDLFDDIPYKYIKKLDDDTKIEVKIEDNDNDDECNTSFEFELDINVSGGSMPIITKEKFIIILQYGYNSPISWFINEKVLLNYEYEDEE